MGVNLRNCPKCGRVFAYQGRNICQKCLESEDDDYALVRRYVRDHPRASVVEVSEETGVEEEKILQYLRDGRLISSGFTEVITCERCGKSIRAGRYCEACKAILDIQLKSAIPQAQRPEPPENKPPRLGRNSDGMHIKKE